MGIRYTIDTGYLYYFLNKAYKMKIFIIINKIISFGIQKIHIITNLFKKNADCC